MEVILGWVAMDVKHPSAMPLEVELAFRDGWRCYELMKIVLSALPSKDHEMDLERDLASPLHIHVDLNETVR
jgi:hypothetical protein